MAAGLNESRLIGRLGKDPETRFTQAGDPVTSFSVAVDDLYKGKDGNKVITTDWFNCVAFKKTAEICSKYLKKGSLVYIEGKMKTSTYEKEGVKHYKTDIHVSKVLMLSGKGEGSDATTQDDGSESTDHIPF
jgi:single-strand DNA-binding protein